MTLHGVQNVPGGSGDDVALLSYKRGSKKVNSGKTSTEPVIFGMATWKHVLELEVTFFQDLITKDVAEKTITFALKVGPRGASKTLSKQAAMGTKVVDMAEFYRDGSKVDRMFPMIQGSNPITLKVSIETHWTHIDNKLIVRGKSPRKERSGSVATTTSTISRRLLSIRKTM